MASRVMTAPLCGRVSKLPQAIAATRCSSSRLTPVSRAVVASCSPMAESAIDRPPEAEPVMPASELTEMKVSQTGSVVRWVIASRTATKAGSEAMTLP